MGDGKNSTDRLKDSIAAALRALSGQKDLEIDFSGGKLTPTTLQNIADATQISLPFLKQYFSRADMDDLRGIADRIALRKRFSDHAMHKRNTPIAQQSGPAFETLEQARCESAGKELFAGASANIDKSLRSAFYKYAHENSRLDSNDAKIDALYLLARQKLLGGESPDEAQKLMKYWQHYFETKISQHTWDELAKSIDNQGAFAKAAHRLLKKLDFEIELDSTDNNDDADDTQPDESDQQQEEKDKQDSDDENDDGRTMTSPSPSHGADDDDEGEKDEPGSGDDKTDNARPDAVSGMDCKQPSNDSPRTPASKGDAKQYKIFSTAYDGVLTVNDLIKRMNVSDDQVAYGHRIILEMLQNADKDIRRLSNRLRRKLLSYEHNHLKCEQDLEEGLLDNTRLSRIVTDPLNPRCFKTEDEYEINDTVVTLLIDNSGSMRGRPIAAAAVSAYFLAKTLEMCKVKVEILGFTTTDWQGGRVRDEWKDQGSSQNPGRLNSLRHVIYKAADTSFRRSQRNMGLMAISSDFSLLKENIDGESLLWAHDRLMKRAEKRKILIVISDGAPLDDATNAKNPEGYLSNHLQKVVDYIENQSPVELSAIGIGYDVSQYYNNAVTIHNHETLGKTMLEHVDHMFDDYQDAMRNTRRKVRPAAKAPGPRP